MFAIMQSGWLVHARRSEWDEDIFLAEARPGEGLSYASKDRYSMREVSSRGRAENERANANVVDATMTRGKGAETGGKVGKV